MKKYATAKRLGRAPTVEDIARIHNGGPNGYKKTAITEAEKLKLKNLDKYWAKV
jgi:hypothetical protein